MRSIILAVFASIVFNGAYAQYAAIKKLADKDFEQQKYFEAAYNYNLLADSGKAITLNVPIYLGRSLSKKTLLEDRAYVYYRLAESYRLYQNYHDAQKWYEKSLRQNYEKRYPLTRLWYGVSLRANNYFDESIAQLQNFKSSFKGDAATKTIGERELATSIFAKQQYASKSTVSVTRVNEAWNNDGGNYALVKNNGDTWLTASKFNPSAKKHLNNIYKKTAENMIALITNQGSVSDMEYGTPSLTASGKRMYLTAWLKNEKGTSMAIYSSENLNGKWSAVKKLNEFVNVTGYKTMQPSVSNDGKRLFYASNRTGGRGGMDIWVSNLNTEGNPVDAANLGSVVNSPADEETPFYDMAKNRLVYSSKGFKGMGGFDLFESHGDIGKWSVPKNLGYPYNSSKDDLYYFTDPENDHKAYLSSDRESDCCLAVFELNNKPIELRGRVASCDSDNVLRGTQVTLLDSTSNKIMGTTETGIAGLYLLKVCEGSSYHLKFEKAGYFSKIIPVNLRAFADTLHKTEICLQGFVAKKPIALKNILYNYNKADLRPEAKIALDSLVQILRDNPTIKIEIASHTDSVGTAAANLILSQLRAEACVNYAIAKGIAQNRLNAKGYGETMPVAPNSLSKGVDNPAGRQLNRRTEFTIQDK